MNREKRFSNLQSSCRRLGRQKREILPPETAAARQLGKGIGQRFLKLTSGTTAEPGSSFSQRTIGRLREHCETMGISERDVNFGVIPISHSYGFSNFADALIVAGFSLALSNDRYREPSSTASPRLALPFCLGCRFSTSRFAK